MPSITPLTPAECRQIDWEVSHYPWWRKRLIELDIFINVWFLNGLLGETISARAGRMAYRHRWWAEWLCDFLDLIENNHGPKAVEADRYRAWLVEQAELNSGLLT